MSDEEFEVEKILKKELRDGQPFYYLKWLGYTNRYNTWEPEDSNDPVCVSSLEARIFWTPLLINFWLSKLEFVGFHTDGNPGPMNVLAAPPNETPQVIYITDMRGEMCYCLQFTNGIMFMTFDEIEAQWAGLVLDFLEQSSQVY